MAEESPLQTLSTKLLPWLKPAFAQLEHARSADHLGHAWLLSGPEGIGKSNLALAFANRLLGHAAPLESLEPDEAVAAFAGRHDPTGRHPDLHWLFPEADKETISVEQVRDLIESLNLTAHRGGAKVVVVEPAEAMTIPAANALLKTLEEPAKNSVLLLVSHRTGRLPATVRSRCQQLKLGPPTAAAIAAWLGVEPAAVVEAERRVGRAPREIAALLKGDNNLLFNELERLIADICEDRADPVAVAQAWAKDRPALVLGWLKRRLHDEARSRAVTDVSTRITVAPTATLHNAWRAVPVRTLFDLYERTEKLANQLGSGLNVELALQALLSSFQTSRGRS